ncbi:SphA family protein [Paraburkholderia terrae]|uniref:Phenol degradation protein meta n=1 Tax=Paraburkholderia terrae TaxID=311230 RepID=A0A2I8ER93_9BURK|nr:transporter [Paraburkholderia terrae]AUT61821.1 phenol degradation protein meta [Paraburkholderia terrae]BDC40235.1 hypothetical protein PTKU15_35320 [Paraburkholderia terrae]
MFHCSCRGRFIAAAVIQCALLSGGANATENGGTNYPIGVNTITPGVQPPPGTYGYLYLAAYESTSLKDNSGNAVGNVSNFSLHAQAAAVRVAHVWRGLSLLGATIETRANIPFCNIDIHFDAHTPHGDVYKSSHAAGLSDIVFAPVMLGWHNGDLHQVAGLEFFLPTGSYDVNRLANPGRHYYSIEPTYALTWFPTQRVELSARALYEFNTINNATDYRSGQEFIVDYNAAFKLTQAWQIGVSGYYYRQMTDDMQHGQVVNGNGNRGQVLGVGPFIGYMTRKIAVAFKYQRETLVRNRPEGNRFWLQVYMPFE